MANLQFRRMTPTRREKFQGRPGKKRCVFWRGRRRMGVLQKTDLRERGCQSSMICSTRRQQPRRCSTPGSMHPCTHTALTGDECFCPRCRHQWHLHQSCTEEGSHIVQLRGRILCQRTFMEKILAYPDPFLDARKNWIKEKTAHHWPSLAMSGCISLTSQKSQTTNLVLSFHDSSSMMQKMTILDTSHLENAQFRRYPIEHPHHGRLVTMVNVGEYTKISPNIHMELMGWF